jgi:hypothetical protein
MNLDGIFNVAGAIVTLAIVTVIFTSPQTANVIKATGNAFSGSLRAATGR